MIDIVRGSDQKPGASIGLIKYFRKRNDIEGVLYFGYPIIGTVEGALHIDALLVSRQNGVIAFDIEEGNSIGEKRSEIQDDMHAKISSKLFQYKSLVKKRRLNVKLEVLTYAPRCKIDRDNDDFELATNESELDSFVNNQKWEYEDSSIYHHLQSAIQAVTSIKTTPKRSKVKKEDSRGAELKKLENTIANLDKHQSQAVIETTEGPQRIRGLAGSGKTIVLALKVAYLHTKHPEWLIAITFNTRSLKNQFKELITRFTYEHKNESPDWDKIRIIHAWGSPQVTGIYYEICKNHNIEYFDYNMAKRSAGRSREFDFVCEKAIHEIESYKETYDAILIDEAQDFSEPFLNLCYNILKKPKRLIWAYDELQNLNKNTMRSPEEVFGIGNNGKPNVQLENAPDQPKQDIILYKCYRNPRPLLATAHALGFGVYRKKGLVQMFDNPTLWIDVGYKIEEGELVENNKVILARTKESSPEFLEAHSPLDDIIMCKAFKDNDEQIKWIADQIEKNLKEDELEYRDIVVIHSNPLTTKKAVGPLKALLYEKGINSHTVGIDTSADGFFEENSITFTGIFRAKGNEAAMVYIVDAQECYVDLELIKKRNILFTAITRSKAWVRICGFGEPMRFLKEEVEKARANDFKLEFNYPTKEGMAKLNIIHRDRTRDEKHKINQNNKNLGELIKDIKQGKLHLEELSPQNVKDLKDILANA